MRFVEEYFVDFNATRAAIRAGYSRRMAKQHGWCLLRHAAVAPEIAKRIGKLRWRLGIGVDEGIVRLSEIARDQATPVGLRVKILWFMVDRAVSVDSGRGRRGRGRGRYSRVEVVRDGVVGKIDS